MLGLGLANAGATSNMVVYLIKEYNVPSVDAAQISTIVSGCVSVAPVAGAIVADTFFGCYPIVAVAMAFSVLARSNTLLLRHMLYACTYISIVTSKLARLVRAGLGHVHAHGEPAQPPAGGVPLWRRTVRAGVGGADGGAVRRRVPAVRERGRGAVQPGDHGREPVRGRRRPRRLLQLVLHLLLRVRRARLNRDRLRPGHGVVGARLRHRLCCERGRPRGDAPRRAVLPTARRTGQPIHRARQGGRCRR